ncbi:MAG: hypothetical protein ACO1QR_00040 [Chthoniobacteraceae bacterium]
MTKLQIGEQGVLIADTMTAAGTERFEWSPTTRTWRSLPAMPRPAFSDYRFGKGNGFVRGVAVAAGVKEDEQAILQLRWKPEKDAEKPFPLQLNNFPKNVKMSGTIASSGAALVCPEGVLIERHGRLAGFWFIPRHDYDTFASSHGYDPLPHLDPSLAKK